MFKEFANRPARGLSRPQQESGERRAERERVECGNKHRDGNSDGELLIEAASDARNEIVGTNTAARINAIATTGPDTSSIALKAASLGDRPSSMCRSTASTTTMASSTTSP